MPNSVDRYTVLRGNPTRTTGHMEQLQTAWVRALCAAAGCVVRSSDIIDDGIDLVLRHTHQNLDQGRDSWLSLQLKCTTAKPVDGHLTVQVPRKRFLQYADPAPTIPTIVVATSIPKTQAHWTFTDDRRVSLFGVSCWINLAGRPTPEGTSDKIPVSVALANSFDDVALALIMNRIGRGATP